jgi:hypothetical protein
MSDKELLVDAAQAAGLPVDFSDSHVGGYWPCGRDGFGDVDQWWNPLIDDGDALRLAVKLRIGVTPTGVAAYAEPCQPIDGVKVTLADEPDIYAATRRAIVRAAASIRRAGKES